MSDQQSAEIPRTDICEQCEYEIVSELVGMEGKHELIHRARTIDEDFFSVTAGKVEVELKCHCSSVTIEFGPGTQSAWKFPDSWMWEDNVDVGEEVLQA